MPTITVFATLTDEIIRRLEPIPDHEGKYRLSRTLLQEAADQVFTLPQPLSDLRNCRINFEADVNAGWLPLLVYRLESHGEPVIQQTDEPTRGQWDPLIGILRGLGYTKTEAEAWAHEIPTGTPEARWEEVLQRKGQMQRGEQKVKAGMPHISTLRTLAEQGCEKTAEDVIAEQGIDQFAIEQELGVIRAYAEGAQDLGTGSLIMDSERGDVTRRIGSGLPTWLQDLGGPKAILAALERKAGTLYDDLLALAIEQVRAPVPF